ncbi:cubilin [Narcine bancroftii]|uniref:cubilin n=1 Tax=Narcine bancroftii TaxID=1343680 RepID=UPI003831A717
MQTVLQRRACMSNPCHHDGTCLNLIDSFFCLCPSNWKGPTCFDDVNECEIHALACQNGATCINTEGSYSCNCTAEWYGPHCTSKFDDCQDGSQTKCEHGICIDLTRVQPNQPNYHCICEAGWSKAPRSSACSSDIDECSLPVHPCSTNPMVPCLNSPGSYSCGNCPAGWEGDGHGCQDIDECKANNGGCSQAPNVQCINTMGSYHCGLCPPAHYFGNGYGDNGCIPVLDTCQHGNPCVNGQCFVVFSSYMCVCGPGWTGTNCTQNINNCASNPCQNEGICTDGIDSYTCTCLQNWTGTECQIPQKADQACGGTYGESEGIITSPNWSNSYPSSRECIYVIQQPTGENIHLQFTHLELEFHNNCSLDYIEVRDGEAETDHLIGRYCGSELPAPITTNGNKLWLKFKANASVTTKGFVAVYKVACGGILHDKGVIQSPYYPNPYPHDRSCEWIIIQPEGQVVTLKFISFDIEKSKNCSHDYLELRDGAVKDSPLIGKYCGDVVPPAVTSIQTSMYIMLKMNSKKAHNGFRVEYASAEKGCGEVLTQLTGTITSPENPANYPHGGKCIWYISVQAGHVIHLTFISFNIEFNVNCSKEYVEVYDVNLDRPMGRYCGRSIPPSVISSGNLMRLLFVSDSNTTKGFLAMYDTLHASTVCREEFFDSTGTFTSPNYPNGYSIYQECIYVITVEDNKQILLNFIDFKVGGYKTCTSAYVEIRNGGYETSPLVGQYCGTKAPPLIVSHSNRLWIKLKSDNIFQYYAFMAHWNGTLTGCGGTITTVTGSFTSPNYPMPYSNNAECSWLIQASAGSVIELQFEQFSLDSSTGCIADYLTIYNGIEVNSNILATLCGNHIPASILSSKNNMYIKLRTDNSRTAGGFFAKYRQICHGMIIANQSKGILESTNFPQPYPSYQDCNWTIQTTAGNIINYTFTAFILSINSCHLAWLKLYDGPSAQSPLIGSFCGNSLPPSGRTSGTNLHVAFHSESSFSGNGFQMLWFQNGCGGDLHGPKGGFNSPGYPNRYPSNQECIWIIQGNSGSCIELTIHDFDVEYQTCMFNVLEVHDGPDIASVQLAQLCSTHPANNSLVISSTGNYITVRFKTSLNGFGRGFNATWRQRAGVCGGIFTASEGEIHSPNYPSPYGINVDCSWVINVDKHYSVFLDFLDFNVGHRQSCDSDYVAVYDGSNEAAPLLRKLCGNILPEGFTSSYNVLYIHFSSQNSCNSKGFRARFHQVCGSCIITDDIGGAITSPLYPGNYSNNQNCSWIIRAQEPFNHVTISFTDIAIENSGAGCSADVLQILDGDNYGAASVGRYCGNTIPHPITSSSDALFVNFISNDINSFRGFRAIYAASTSACGGMFHMESGAFNSPNYPEKYPSNSECIWYIISSPGNRVQVSFISFNIAYSINCSLDYLEIREGNATGQLIGRFCGSILPANCTSVIGHILWVKFVSGLSSSQLGFRAIFSHLYGNEIVGIQGQITSPLWPQHYPDNVNYHWTITAPVFHIIHARIQEMDIDTLFRCRYDKLMFYDGPNIRARRIGTYCGSELPPAVSSTGNTLTLQFISDYSVNGKGFLLEWFAVQNIVSPTATPTLQPGSCGGVVMAGASPTFLFSPGWPNEYESYLDCAWIIWAPQSTVELNILALDIEAHWLCHYDKLVVRDGDNNLSPILATLCGRELPGPLQTTGETMFLHFTSDEDTNGGGFNASYHSTCGGHLTADHGVITSPNYPHVYTPNLNCTWHVEVTNGFIIVIHFSQPFQIQGSDTDCSSGDYLELRNGPDKFSPALTSQKGIGRYCGENPPTIMNTTDNQLFVHFLSDGINEGHGFKFTYDASNLACGRNIFISDSNAIGYIASKNYPNNYPENIDCIWTITVPSGEAVQLDFDNSFFVEPHFECDFDYLELRDGGTSDAPLIGRFCGSTKPSCQRSTGTIMYVRFQTNAAVNHMGFKAKYSIADCGGMVSGQSGSLQSPRFPSRYPDNSHCEWLLEGPMGHYLTVTFEVFSLENTTNCTKDFVEIREYNASGRLLGRHCGNTLPHAMDTSDNLAYVSFNSDAFISDSGFRLHFVASIEECGGELTAGTGTFTSPNYPDFGPLSRQCQWTIIVQVGRRVTLTLNDLQLEAHNQCNYDYVSIYNGLHPNSPRLQKYCGIIESGTQVKSSGNTMRVVFVTDGSISNRGLSATYTSEEDAVCGSVLMDPVGNFSSPSFNGESNYMNNLNCEWSIQNSHIANSSIYIHFISFHLGDHPTCQQDYIELRVGNSNGDLIARLCGPTVPTPLQFPFPQIWVHFISDSSVQDLGFVAEYSFTECGGVQTGENGFLSSPNFPSPYNPLIHCAWMLEVPEGYTITLSFVYFNLTCGWESITILNGGAFNSPVIGKYCGITPNETIKSGTSKLFIIFNSNYSMPHNGFYATWKSDSLGCGGFIHAESGSFKSPNWPQNFPDECECTWRIIGQESQHLEITFDENFHIPDGTNFCETSFVKIWGGISEFDETLLATVCGSTPPPRPIIAPANVVTVRFQSEGNTGTGFSASFTNRCGANFTASTGRVMSSNYPGHYESNLNCEYWINASNHQFTILQFEAFSLEEDSICAYDNLKIYSETPANGYPVATVCGSVIPGPISTYGPMLLVFSTDSIKTHSGFVANYHLASCGGRFHGSAGTLTSPIYSHNQYSNINCTYLVTVGANRNVQMKFDKFKLDTSSACSSNYVAVYNGPNTFAPLLGQFCGSNIPPILRSSNNSIFLVFKTNGFHAYGGWQASYAETLGSNHECGRFLTESSGSFSSSEVDLDQLYEKSFDCLWYISAPVNKIIHATFTVLLLENATNGICNFDYINIYDGDNINSPLVGTYCGSRLPPPIASSSNFLTVRFVSRSSIKLDHFNITYTATDLLCGGVFNATKIPQNITYPGYPQDYPPNTVCHWTISAPEEKKIKVALLELNLPDCTLDYLEIRDWPETDFEQVHRFCGPNLTAADFYSRGRTIKVDFKFKDHQNGNKFRLMYEVAGK